MSINNGYLIDQTGFVGNTSGVGNASSINDSASASGSGTIISGGNQGKIGDIHCYNTVTPEKLLAAIEAGKDDSGSTDVSYDSGSKHSITGSITIGTAKGKYNDPEKDVSDKGYPKYLTVKSGKSENLWTFRYVGLDASGRPQYKFSTNDSDFTKDGKNKNFESSNQDNTYILSLNDGHIEFVTESTKSDATKVENNKGDSAKTKTESPKKPKVDTSNVKIKHNEKDKHEGITFNDGDDAIARIRESYGKLSWDAHLVIGDSSDYSEDYKFVTDDGDNLNYSKFRLKIDSNGKRYISVGGYNVTSLKDKDGKEIPVKTNENGSMTVTYDKQKYSLEEFIKLRSDAIKKGS